MLDHGSPDFKRRITALQTTPGYCVQIEVDGLAHLKQGGLYPWLAQLHACFAGAHLLLNRFQPVMSMGNILTFYVEAADLSANDLGVLHIYDDLWRMIHTHGNGFPSIKAGAAYCESAYAVSFLNDQQAYQGSDIDMTAKLLAMAQTREIVTERRFYEKLKTACDLESTGRPWQRLGLHGPTRLILPEIERAVEIFRSGEKP